ncbi:TetR/AcrR family transcriptional regulator [Nocardia huaxiensis]|uniref:TetR/AcrR family transcriptional regulator n=1 Tax=Nocardia huaxiensis TaxID=2755382 RepID=A0A7D6ZQW0_9NOCA|nr:TetR/AcrR family transcriptional regulator [Nocardia huaxiensis]QLY33103.1 TetR/AcrR family transcriptional regulator [Nocardia huaxiensis]UFS93126.1 TetR/AcrR family transcriptional regulator [Nocardia huaxiensis]
MAGTLRAQQREQTRRTLLRESRRLFATKGYAAVGLSEITAAAGVTKGALYHNFESKTELFRAVLEQVQNEVGDRVAAAAEQRTQPWDQLVTGCETFLTACTAPEIQRIMLIDGPAVLGWHDWRAMDEAASARHLGEVLTELVAAGVIPPQPIAPLTHLLSGAMNEAALWLATATAPDALDETLAALRRLLGALQAPADQ